MLNGETIVENTTERFEEHLVYQINLNRAWHGSWATKLVIAFEQDMIDLPRDDNLENDGGIHMVSKARAKDLKDSELY